VEIDGVLGKSCVRIVVVFGDREELLWKEENGERQFGGGYGVNMAMLTQHGMPHCV